MDSPQSWNRFSYVTNNPIRFNDPTGHRNCEEDGYNCKGDNVNIKQAVALLKNSKLGQSSYNLLIANGYTIGYSTNDSGYVKDKHIGVPVNKSPAYIAGTIAHEATHVAIHAAGSLLQEYQAMLVGDIVRNEIIQAGHGTSSDMRHPLSDFTVNLNNPNKKQLSDDLTDWFTNKREKIYIDKYKLPALPLARDLDRDR